MGYAVDGYFPEILAADLEQSSSIFALRCMTSGSPDAALSSEDKYPTTTGYIGWPNRFPVTPSHHTVLSPARSLGPIREKMPVVSFLGNRTSPQRSQEEEIATDSESSAGTDASKGGAERSNISQDRSILTVATSLTSSWISNLKNASPSTSEPDRERSWIDPDTDDDEPEHTCRDALAALSPRPQTPPKSQTINDTNNAKYIDRTITSPIRTKQIHQKSHSISAFASSSKPQKRYSLCSRKEGRSRSPPPPISDDEAPPIPRRRRSRASTSQTQHDETYRILTSRCEDLGLPMDHQVYQDFTLADHMLNRNDTRPVIHSYNPSGELDDKPKRAFIRPPPPSSPLPTVESWLDTNTHSYATHHNDDGFRAVPLPPNVIETLRISVTCFPETMLLTSSLTVETIRSYSKKLRHSTAGCQTNLAKITTTSFVPETSCKSLWRKVASYKKHASPSEPAGPLISAGGLTASQRCFRAASNDAEEPVMQHKTWEYLKIIFNGASDYICDALWAHIIAYNYISTHVPRRRGLEPGHQSSPKDEIPKKAAYLLGLASATAQDVQRSVNKLSVPFASITQRQDIVGEVPAGRRAAAQETAMRDLQAELMRCIARLIATAKFMVEDGRHDGPVMDLDLKEQGADVFLARSLCEIVRLSEDEAA